jgi:hypothetical protein
MLTELATVKARLGIADATDDALLTGYIQQASAMFERHCNRVFARTVAATQEFPANELEIALRYYPIEVISAIHLKTSEDGGWELQSDVAYLLRGACILSFSSPLGSSRVQARVTYTGGYVLPGTAPGAGQIALPKDVENACVEQVCYWYRARHRGGINSASGGQASIGLESGLGLLRVVKDTLELYHRIQL